MRRIAAFLGLALVAGGALVWASCKTMNTTSTLRDDAGSAAMATNQRIGHKLIDNCRTCHHSTDFYKKWLVKWSGDTKATTACLAGATDVNAKLTCLEARSNGVSTAGLYRAYLKSDEVKGWLADAKSSLQPTESAALDARYNAYFKGSGKLWMEPNDEFSDADLKEAINWIATDAAVQFVQTASEDDPNTGSGGACTTQIGPEVRAHLIDASTGQPKGLWAAKDLQENGMQMFACNGAADPSQCFADANTWKPYTLGSGVSPANPDSPYKSARFIRLKDYTVKHSAYWTRSSPDGRFVGNGIIDKGAAGADGKPTYDAYGLIDDLQRGRSVRINAMYDPGFTPDGQWFTYHGWVDPTIKDDPGHVIFCPNSLLTSNVTTIDPGTNPRCFARVTQRSATGETTQTPLPIAEYHSVGTSLDQPFEVVAQASWANDNGGYDGDYYSARTTNADVNFGNNTLNIYAFGSGDQRVLTTKTVPNLGNQGDFMMTPSAKMVFSRFAADGSKAHLGYKIHMLDLAFDSNGVSGVTDKVVGTICSFDDSNNPVFGQAKVLFSYDERFVVSHRYTADGANVDVTQSSSDVYIYDLLTQQSVKVTNMPKGVYALYPHFRADGWLYFHVRVRDGSQCGSSDCPDSIVATDVALQMAKTQIPSPQN